MHRGRGELVPGADPDQLATAALAAFLDWTIPKGLAFLATDAASYVQGVVLNVDGGRTAV